MKVQYIRVSNLEQNTDRQNQKYYQKKYIDKISGTIPLFDRPKGKQLKKDIDKGLITELHVHSIDRLGRSTLDILNTINYLSNKKVCLISEKEGIQTLINDKENLSSKLIINILATLAEFENNIRKERQAEGIAIAKIKGIYKGRKNGSKLSDRDFLEKHKNVVKELQNNQSIRRTAKLCNISATTVQKIKKILNN